VSFNLLSFSLIILAFISGLFGIILLIRYNWFKAWLIGNFGLLFLSITAVSCLIFITLKGYSTNTDGHFYSNAIATLSFSEVGSKHFQVELSTAKGEELVFDLKGDLWKMDVTILAWSGFMAQKDLTPYYRFKKMSSSYMLFDDAEYYPDSSFEVEHTFIDLVLSQLLSKGDIPFLESFTRNTSDLPMSDGALFSIHLSKTGLIVRPKNQKASLSIR